MKKKAKSAKNKLAHRIVDSAGKEIPLFPTGDGWGWTIDCKGRMKFHGKPPKGAK